MELSTKMHCYYSKQHAYIANFPNDLGQGYFPRMRRNFVISGNKFKRRTSAFDGVLSRWVRQKSGVEVNIKCIRYSENSKSSAPHYNFRSLLICKKIKIKINNDKTQGLFKKYITPLFIIGVTPMLNLYTLTLEKALRRRGGRVKNVRKNRYVFFDPPLRVNQPEVKLERNY